MRWPALLVVTLAHCAGGGASPPAARPAPPLAYDGGTLRPVKLEYKGRHQGEHPPWDYHQTVTILATDRGGRPVWRKVSDFGQNAPMATTWELDRKTLAPVRSELVWNGVTTVLTYSPGRTSGEITEKGLVRRVERRHSEPVVASEVLDLYIAALPLVPGYQIRVSLLDFWLLDEPPRYETRPFTIAVKGEAAVTVPAGTLPALVVAIDPADGNERLKATYHVRKQPPHYPIRMEYVVNPVTVGEEKRSVGVDELVSLSFAP